MYVYDIYNKILVTTLLGKNGYDFYIIKAVKSLKIFAKCSFIAFSIYEQPRLQIC